MTCEVTHWGCGYGCSTSYHYISPSVLRRTAESSAPIGGAAQNCGNLHFTDEMWDQEEEDKLEINRRLNAIGSLLSPQQEVRRAAISDDDDDIIIVSSPRTEALDSDSPREIVLKFRSRTDLFKIPIQSTSPLSEAVEQLSLKLQVPPSRILLLRKEVELPVDATATKLGLGITDIIDCVVITEEEDRQTDAGADADTITIRLQGQERGSGEDFTLHKDAPLGLVLKQYVSRLALGQRQSVRFLFDGSKVNESHTPSQLEMEDGDVIEVWA
ncbi:NF2IP protein, partial [Amia calva]|nr:NF2IP protein [Amia calva]